MDRKKYQDAQEIIAGIINKNGHRIRLTELASCLADLIPVGETFGTYFSCENLSAYLANNDFFFVNTFGQQGKISDTFVYINNKRRGPGAAGQRPPPRGAPGGPGGPRLPPPPGAVRGPRHPGGPAVQGSPPPEAVHPAAPGHAPAPAGPAPAADGAPPAPGPSGSVADVRREALVLEVLRRSPNQTSNLSKLGQAMSQARLAVAQGTLKFWISERPELFKVLPGDHVQLQPLSSAPGFDSPAAEAALQLALADYIAGSHGRKHVGSDVGAFVSHNLHIMARGALGQFLKARDTVFRPCDDPNYVELLRPGWGLGPGAASPRAPADDAALSTRAPHAAAALPNGAPAANGAPAGGAPVSVREQLERLRVQSAALHEVVAAQQLKMDEQEAELQYQRDALATVYSWQGQALPPRPSAAPAGGDARAPEAGAGEAAAGAPRLFIVGGHDSDNWLDSVEVFCPGGGGGGGAWATLPPQGFSRSFAAAAMLGSVLYVAGGSNGDAWFDSVQRYDIAAEGGAWAQVAPMSVQRGNLGVVALGGQVIACGGGVQGGPQYDLVEAYDPATDRWLPAAPMTSLRFALGAATLDGCVYAVGGFDGEAYLTSAERFDPRVGRWEKLQADMAVRRGSHACCASDGLLYAVGGFDMDDSVASVEVYDARAGRWQFVAPMSSGRAYGGAVALGGRVYALGGLKTDMITYAPLVEEYQPAANVWAVVGVPPHVNKNRGFFACAAWEP